MCRCAAGATFCLIETEMHAFFADERHAAEDPDPDANGFNAQHEHAMNMSSNENMSSNNIKHKRCYRHAAIYHLHYKFRQPLAPCIVAAIRAIWPSSSGRCGALVQQPRRSLPRPHITFYAPATHVALAQVSLSPAGVALCTPSVAE